MGRPNFLISLIQSILKRRGLKISKYPEPDKRRRQKIIKSNGINLLLDVGANVGGYGKEMREIGYSGRIISFEPTSLAFSLLQMKSDQDDLWESKKIALGASDEKTEINISLNQKSNSILPILPLSIENAPDSQYFKTEEIFIKTLDELFADIAKPEDNVMLKIDTQGYELKVLEGAKNALSKIKVVQLELSFSPLYKKETTFFEMVTLMEGLGFELYSLETDLSFTNPETGKMLQVDAIFCKK